MSETGPSGDAGVAAVTAPQFPITTALEFPEWAVQRHLGMVYGVIVRSMGAAKGITAGFRALAGGEVKQYTKLVEDSRRHAIDRMIENARLIGANGIISMRFDSSEVAQSLTEIVAYGTAVVVGARQ
ncbi:MAG: heavy metal-binding domain-containing protein [Acidimicrobiales bacterium]|nr:heavy metal-binding domain-containing protein [Acidimicrobiales bacterium]